MSHKKPKATKNKAKVEVVKKANIPPLMQAEAHYFQELIEVSNRYAALLKQKAQYEFIINKLEENRKKIQDGVIKLPVTLPLIPNVMTYNEDNKKEIFKFFDEQIVGYKNSIKTLIGQISHRHEDYTEVAVRTREFLTKRYGRLSAKNITRDRKLVKEEETLFEAEFKKLVDDPKTMQEFKNASKEAIKHNVKRAVKKV